MFRDPRPSARPGRSLIELVTVLAAGAIITGAAAATLVTGSGLGRLGAGRAETLADRRLAVTLLGHEVRTIVAGTDGFEMAADTVALRAFRASAIVCAADAASARLRVRGLRQPDPLKDSMIVLASTGPERVFPFASAARVGVTAACPALPDEYHMELRPGTGLVAGDITLFFERGAYHFSTGALRYRRGGSGRQPLTALSFDDDSTDFVLAARSTSSGSDTIAVLLRLGSRPPTATSVAGPPTVVRIPMLNALLPLDSIPLAP